MMYTTTGILVIYRIIPQGNLSNDVLMFCNNFRQLVLYYIVFAFTFYTDNYGKKLQFCPFIYYALFMGVL